MATWATIENESTAEKLEKLEKKLDKALGCNMTRTVGDPERNAYTVSMYWNDGYGNSNDYILGVFSTKEFAAEFIYRTTGMRVNDDWSVRFYSHHNARSRGHYEYAEMYISDWTMNYPDCGCPNLEDVHNIKEVMDL